MFKIVTNWFIFIIPVFLVLVTSVSILSSERNSQPRLSSALNGGTVTGFVRFPEDYPDIEKINVTKDQQICGAFKYSESFVVSEQNHGLKNVVVMILNVKGGKKASDGSTVTLDQKKCQYVPHVQAVPIGSKLQILNDDGILHNVHAYFNGSDPKDTVFNKAQPKFLKKINQKLDKVGTYFFKCDVHDHMSAFIAVMDHPYYAVTDELGEFTIPGVPPGTYTVQAWHEVLGTLEKEVHVQAGKPVQINFDILPNE